MVVGRTAGPGFWWRVGSPIGVVPAAFVLLFVVAVIGYAVLGESNQDTVGTIAVFVGSLAILLMGVGLMARLPRHNRAVAFRTKRRLRGAIGVGIASGLGMIVLAGVIMQIGISVEDSVKDRVDELTTDLGSSTWVVALAVAALVVLAPLGEELVFRALLLRGLVRRIPFWWAALITSVLFGLSHLDVWITMLWPRLLALVIIGLGLAWLYRARGYWASVSAHATVNLVAAVVLLLNR